MTTKKRADQLRNGDLIVFTYQSRQTVGSVNAVMQFDGEGKRTNLSILNGQTGIAIQVLVPNHLEFEVIETGTPYALTN